MKRLLKRIVPLCLWRKIRKCLILRKHKQVGKVCGQLIDDYLNGKIKHAPIHPLKEFGTDKIIWQYWGQGFEHFPPSLRFCLDSVERYKGDYTLIRLTDQNLSEYVSFPQEILQKRNSFSLTHFSDLLRLALLATYGGVWIDTTIFLTGLLPEQYFTKGFFVYQRDAKELHQTEWENTFAYYWGWDKGFKVRVLNSLIYGKKGNKTIVALYDILYDYWLNHSCMPDYFLFQILFHELMERRPELNCSIVSDCLPHYAAQTVTNNFLSFSFEDALQRSTVHKVSYKMNPSDIELIRKSLDNRKN